MVGGGDALSGPHTLAQREESNRLRAAFGRAGFHPWDAGGGCWVLARWDRPARRVVMVTHECEDIPERFADPVYVGEYALDEYDDYDVVIGGDDYESAASFLARHI